MGPRRKAPEENWNSPFDACAGGCPLAKGSELDGVGSSDLDGNAAGGSTFQDGRRRVGDETLSVGP